MKHLMIMWQEWYEDWRIWDLLQKIDPFRIKNPVTREPSNYFVATFTKSRLKEFVNHDKPWLFFSTVERSRLVYHMLEQARYMQLFFIILAIIIELILYIPIRGKPWNPIYVRSPWVS